MLTKRSFIARSALAMAALLSATVTKGMTLLRGDRFPPKENYAYIRYSDGTTSRRLRAVMTEDGCILMREAGHARSEMLLRAAAARMRREMRKANPIEQVIGSRLRARIEKRAEQRKQQT